MYFSPGDAELDLFLEEDLKDQCNALTLITIFYFCSFILIVAFILLNVVIAVILDNFQTSSRKEHLAIKVQHIEAFAKVRNLNPELFITLWLAGLVRNGSRCHMVHSNQETANAAV